MESRVQVQQIVSRTSKTLTSNGQQFRSFVDTHTGDRQRYLTGWWPVILREMVLVTPLSS
jgi:hypothetical protein